MKEYKHQVITRSKLKLINTQKDIQTEVVGTQTQKHQFQVNKKTQPIKIKKQFGLQRFNNPNKARRVNRRKGKKIKKGRQKENPRKTRRSQINNAYKFFKLHLLKMTESYLKHRNIEVWLSIVQHLKNQKLVLPYKYLKQIPSTKEKKNKQENKQITPQGDYKSQKQITKILQIVKQQIDKHFKFEQIFNEDSLRNEIKNSRAKDVKQKYGQMVPIMAQFFFSSTQVYNNDSFRQNQNKIKSLFKNLKKKRQIQKSQNKNINKNNEDQQCSKTMDKQYILDQQLYKQFQKKQLFFILVGNSDDVFQLNFLIPINKSQNVNYKRYNQEKNSEIFYNNLQNNINQGKLDTVQFLCTMIINQSGLQFEYNESFLSSQAQSQ